MKCNLNLLKMMNMSNNIDTYVYHIYHPNFKNIITWKHQHFNVYNLKEMQKIVFELNIFIIINLKNFW